MKRLPGPDWDALEDFDAIVRNKHKAGDTLREVRDSLSMRYRSYQESAPNFLGFVALDLNNIQREALLACIAPNKRTNACKDMLGRLSKLAENSLCPLCGIDTPATWDHYLPKSDFPEFAVLCHNLIHACSRCNTDRNDRWQDEYGRLILHMYYDLIVEERPLISAKVDVGNYPEVHYKLECSKNDSGFAGQFARHCGTLSLIPRFNAAGKRRLLEVVGELRVSPRRSRAKTRHYLREIAEDRARLYGRLHWQVALYQGAADSDAFLEYALEGPES